MRRIIDQPALACSLPDGVRQSRNRVASRRADLRLGGWEDWLLLSASLALSLAGGYVLTSRLGLFPPDAQWYTVQAWSLLTGDVSRLSMFHTPMPPFPTVLQAPLLLVPALRYEGLAAGILSALAGALLCVLLNRMLNRWSMPRLLRYPILLLFALNPIVLFNGGNGSSEMLAALLILLSLQLVSNWYEAENLQSLIQLGFTLGLLSLTRYEALPYVLLLPLLLLFAPSSRKDQTGERAFGVLATCFVPAVSTLGLGALVGLMVESSPQYWVEGERTAPLQLPQLLSDLAAFSPLPQAVSPQNGSILEGVPALGMSPLFALCVALLLLISWRRMDRLSASLIVATAFFPMLYWFAPTLGGAEPPLRGLFLTTVLGVALGGRLYQQARAFEPAKGPLALMVGLALLSASALSTGTTASAMANAPASGNSSAPFVEGLLSANSIASPWQEERSVAGYIQSRDGASSVLVDDFEGYRVLFFSARPELFVTRGTPAFPVTLKAPSGRVDHLLVRDPQLEGVHDLVASRYPALYALGGSGAELVGDWPGAGWRLYRLGSE